ncbi:MAG TPA: MerR family transcriptional regulator [Xanthobacteraceae bacterium]|nr:MerR family transcriptional regulator [Xanthobacteraceae bacterium]
MNNYTPPRSLMAAGDDADGIPGRAKDERFYTIGEMAKRFELSFRALRFYESLGLLTPDRQGRHRFYRRKDADRLAAVLKAKEFGFTLRQIRQLLAGQASDHPLELSREQCLKQIALLERRLAQTERALAELRRICPSP